MTKNIKMKDGFIHIEDFRDLVDVDSVKYYNVKVKDDDTVILKFYDKKKKLVRPYDTRKD